MNNVTQLLNIIQRGDKERKLFDDDNLYIKDINLTPVKPLKETDTIEYAMKVFEDQNIKAVIFMFIT